MSSTRAFPSPSLHLFVLRRNPAQREVEELNTARALAVCAWADLRARGLRVTVQHEHYALEVLATDEQAASAMGAGLYRSYCRGPVDPAELDSTDRARRVAELWNVRFDAKYREQYHDRAKPQPPLDRDSQGLRRFAAAFPHTLAKLAEDMDIFKGDWSNWKEHRPKVFAAANEVYIQSSAKSLLDVSDTLGPLFELPIEPEESHRCTLRFSQRFAPRELHGRMVVAVILVQVAASGHRFADAAQERRVLREVIDGLGWLVAQHPDGNLTFVLRFEVPVAQEASSLHTPDVLAHALSALHLTVDPGEVFRGLGLAEKGLRNYLDALGSKLSGLASKAIFITPYADDDIAVAETLANTWVAYIDNWRGNGEATVDGIVAHEFLHNFGAKDEYVKEPESTKKGFECDCMVESDGIPNGNCIRCTSSRPQLRCVMNGFRRRLCPYTRAMIGWTDLFVEIETARNTMAGTDDRLWLDIGDRVLLLGTAEHDDFEPGQKVGYGFWGVSRDEIRRILLRKDPGDLASAWLPKQVRVWYRREQLWDLVNDENRWLDDATSSWGHPEGIRDHDYVTLLDVELDTSAHGGGRSARLWIDERSWVLPCCIPEPDGGRAIAKDRFSLDPGTGLRRSQLRSIRLEWVEGRLGTQQSARFERLAVRANRSTLLEVVPSDSPPPWPPKR